MSGSYQKLVLDLHKLGELHLVFGLHVRLRLKDCFDVVADLSTQLVVDESERAKFVQYLVLLVSQHVARVTDSYFWLMNEVEKKLIEFV